MPASLARPGLRAGMFAALIKERLLSEEIEDLKRTPGGETEASHGRSICLLHSDSRRTFEAENGPFSPSADLLLL